MDYIEYNTNYETDYNPDNDPTESFHARRVEEINTKEEAEEEGREENPQRLEAKRKLEEFQLDFVEQLNAAYDAVEDEEKTGAAKTHKETHLSFEIGNRDPKSSGTRTMEFPNLGRGSNNLAQYMTVVDAAHTAMESGIGKTKRDLYYDNVLLFASQDVADRLVDDLAMSLGCGREHINIRAAPKGMFSGASLKLKLKGKKGAVTATDYYFEMIPAFMDILEVEAFGIRWILVVEKGAVFTHLHTLGVAGHPSMPGKGIIITGVGYPDMATSQLLAHLANMLPNVPIFGLFDGDPYGLDIASVYKFGSPWMQHETANLVCARLEWLGIKADELEEWGIGEHERIPFNVFDSKKATAMLARKENKVSPDFLVGLKAMAASNTKVELECLPRSGVGYLEYLAKKMTPLVRN